MSGQVSHLSGIAAEEAVARRYKTSGRDIIERRWRGRSGEIDIIAKDGDTLVFVEVKKSRDFGRAAQNLSQAQIRRLYVTAQEYLCTLPTGLSTDARFDVVLLDACGRQEVIENALCA